MLHPCWMGGFMTKRILRKNQICSFCGEFYEEKLDKKCPNPDCRRKQPEDYKQRGRPKKHRTNYNRFYCKTKGCTYSWLYVIPPNKALVCPICNKRNYWHNPDHIKKKAKCSYCFYSWKPRKRKYHKDWRCPVCRKYIPIESLNYNPTDKQIRLAKDLGLHYDGLDRIQLSLNIKKMLNVWRD
jgi:hypothetical protein